MEKQKQTRKFTRLFNKLLICVVAVMALSFYSCKKKEMPKAEPTDKNIFTLSSNSFTDGGEIPPRCAKRKRSSFISEDEDEHLNHSPQLSWKNAPKGTTSFLIIMEKSNEKESNFWGYHEYWHVYNIPANKTSLTEDDRSIDRNSNHYYGPNGSRGEIVTCQFTIYALDLPAYYFDHTYNLPPFSKERIELELSDHILASASITGNFTGK